MATLKSSCVLLFQGKERRGGGRTTALYCTVQSVLHSTGEKREGERRRRRKALRPSLFLPNLTN